MLKSRLLFASAMSASLLLAFGFDDGALGFSLFYALAFLLLIALISVLTAPFLLPIVQSAQEDAVFKKDAVAYSCAVRNLGPWLFPRISLEMGSAELVAYGDEPPVFPLGPRGRFERRHILRFPYRGIYPVGVRRMVVTDFLGLFRRTIRPKELLSVTVLPSADEDFQLSLRREPQNAALCADPFFEDYSSVADVRKYADSDSLRKIHWKLSAKRGELIVKNYNAIEPDPTILLLDTHTLPLSGRERAALEDKIISYAASAAGYFMEARLSADLVFGPGSEGRISLNRNTEIREVFRVLAGVPFEARSSIAAEARELAGTCHLVVFLAVMDESAHSHLKKLISLDHRLILYYFHSPSMPVSARTGYLLENLAACGAGVTRVSLTP